MTKSQWFLLLSILAPIIIFISLFYDQLDWSIKEKKFSPRPMVELTDEELNEVIGQAGIQFINENFNFTISPDHITSFADLKNQMIAYMTHLQETDPQQAMQTYANMINTVNSMDTNPHIIAGPNVTHIQINLQHVMENVIMNGVNFMSNASSHTGIGTFGIQGLEVHAQGTFHIFIRND